MASLGFAFGAMASRCELRLAGADDTALGAAARAAIDEVRRIEAKFSRYQAGSVVSRINAAAGTGEAITVDEETAGLLDFGSRLHALSGGRFDLSSGVLRRAWDFRAGRLPSAAEIEALLPLVGWARVHWDGRRVALPLAGMELDVGGCGKEYAADRAHAVLTGRGLGSGYVNLGGDIRVLGPQPDGRPWRFAIQHPRDAATTCASIELAEGALATSGDYERYFEAGGRRFCHLLDPRSGWPVGDWQSVSVVAPLCAAAGALATIAMIQGKDALEFLHTQKAEFFAVDAGGRQFASGRYRPDAA